MKKKILSGLLSLAMSVSLLAGVPQPVMAETNANEVEEVTTPDVQNDIFWQDTDGNTIFSQGGGIFKFGDTYYWYGVKYEEAVKYAQDPLTSYSVDTFAGVTCYSSTDMKNWKYEGLVVEREDVTGHTEMGEQEVAWVGRLGVAYMEETGTYALFVQHECDDPDGSLDSPDMNLDNTKHDGYWSKQVLVLTSDTPNGKFEWNQRINMYDYTDGTSNTGDQTVFTDPDTNKDYLVYSFGRGRNKIFISEIVEQEDGKVGLDESYMVFSGAGREGNCMFKYNNKYYICASDLYGWNASHAYYIVLDSLEPEYLATLNTSPKTTMAVMDGCSDDYCHVTQTGFFYTVEGTEQDTVIFCGDRWAGFAGNGLGFNQWCPLSFDANGNPYFNSLSAWNFDLETGNWTVDKTNNYVKNGSFDADRVSSTNLTGWTNTITEGEAPVGNVNNRVTGKYALKIGEGTDFAAKVSQVISSSPYVELPDGTYDLKAKVKTSGTFDTLNMYAKCGDLTSQTAITESYDTYTEVALNGVVVSDGSVEVGFAADGEAGAYCYVDDVTLVLSENQAATGSITGNITSDTDKILTITATAEDGTSYVCTVKGDADSFTISPVKAGTYTVAVTAHACEITNANQEITVTSDSEAAVEDITVVNRSGNASGKVVDDAGEAVVDAAVTLSAEGKESVTVFTAADGTYTFEDVEAGTYTISFERRGYAANEDIVSSVEILLNDTVSIADAVMTKNTGDVAGVVKDADGNPVSGAVVTYYFRDDNSVTYTATTDADGAYSMEGLVEGVYMAIATTITNPDNVWQEFTAGNNCVNVVVDEVANGNLQFAEDLTDMIVNPTFNTAKDLTGWTNGVTSTGGYRTGKNNTHGTYSLAPWANSAFDMNTYQTIEGLEEGRYLVTCWASAGYSETERIDFYAKDGDGNDLAREAIPDTDTYRTVVLLVEVTDGTLTIGIDGHFEGGSWANIDDFHLGKLPEDAEVAPGESTVTEELDNLTQTVTEAATLKKEDYTEESWQALADAISAAEEVQNADSATREEVIAARKAIEDAIAGLKAAEPVVVDKTALNTAIADVEKLTATDYEAATWNALQSALTAAKAEAAKEDATQESVDAALKALTDAKANLKPVTAGGTNNDGANNGGTNNGGTNNDTTNNGEANNGGTTNGGNQEAEETTIVLNTKKVVMGLGEKNVKLTATVKGAAANQPITWTSSKTSVVKVDAKGKLKTAKKKTGTAVITATTADGKKATCTVTVKKAPKKITVKAKKTKLKVGQTTKITVKKYTPAKAASYKLTFKSSNKKVASVSADGVVKAKKKGTAKITVTTYNKKKATIKIKVTK